MPMNIIYIKREDVIHLHDIPTNVTKIWAPLTYDRAYDVDKYSRLELSVYLMYSDGMLLVRNDNLRFTPGIIPSIECSVPPFMQSTDIFDAKESFSIMLDWNMAYAIASLRRGMDGYITALEHGQIDMSSMLHNALGMTITPNINYCPVNFSFEGEWVRINCYINVSKIDDLNPFVYVEKASFMRYFKWNNTHTNKSHMILEDIGRYYPVYSNDDDRVRKWDEIGHAFECVGQKSKNIL